MRFASIAAFVSALLATAPALADERCDLAVAHTIGFGFLLPEPGCPTSLHGDVGAAVGTVLRAEQDSDTQPLDVRIFAEAGVLVRAEEGVHVGPVVAVSGFGHDRGGDEGVKFEDTEVDGLLRTRVWALEGALSLDLAIGPGVYLRSFDNAAAPTVHFEIGPRIAGTLGVFAAYDVVFQDEGTAQRFMGGASLTWGGAAIAACVAAGC